jgi:poly-gamma-glutamate capsule biosynthesis protein CapA/YwtB (metallophosphatase superfamily)
MKTHTSFVVGAALLSALSLLPRAAATQQAAATVSTVPVGRTQERAAAHGSTWSFAAVGDAIINRRLAPFDNPGDPRFQQVAQIIRRADAAMVNLETSLFRLSEFTGWPHWPPAQFGGNWQLGPPEAALDLKLLGFDLFSRSNNHSFDYGVEGMRVTDKLLDDNGLIHAGSGMSLGEASRPGYLETPKGRIAFISLATTVAPAARAGAPRPDMPGRPGLNVLRVDTTYEANAATFEALRAAAASGLGDEARAGQPQIVRIFGHIVRPGPENRVMTKISASDEGRILREIRNAARQADYVIVTSHSHESTVVPPTWLSEFIKKCLDAGAVTYVVHGPHVLRGIEIYHGKPIFYGVGEFVYQNLTNDRMPADIYQDYGLADTSLASDLYGARFPNGWNSEEYESAITVPTFQGSQLAELKLYPLDLGRNAPISQRGTPRLADDETGRAIIERVAKMSAPFGTTIVYQNGIGVWRPGTSTTQSR